MAFITQTNDSDDETILSEVMSFHCQNIHVNIIIQCIRIQDSSNPIPPSFLTMHVTDPFATALGGSSDMEYPNAKRNLLDDLNSAGAEQTMLPPPPQKENIEVYLR